MSFYVRMHSGYASMKGDGVSVVSAIDSASPFRSYDVARGYADAVGGGVTDEKGKGVLPDTDEVPRKARGGALRDQLPAAAQDNPEENANGYPVIYAADPLESKAEKRERKARSVEQTLYGQPVHTLPTSEGLELISGEFL